jgi:hypothetical protein
MLDDRPALVPAGVPDGVGARMPRRFGTAGWVAATVLCALSVYAVRDTMFAPLAKSDAPSSAWETRTQPGDTTPALVAATGSTHIDLSDHDGSATDTGSATGTTVPDVDPGPPSIVVGDAGAGGASADVVSPATSPSVPEAGAAPESTADPSASSTPSTSTPDTLGGHGANSGGGRGGSGNSSGSP